MLRYLLFSAALERGSGPDNTGQWLIHTEFLLGAGMCIHTGEECPEARPPCCNTNILPAWHRSLAWPRHWHLWPGEAAGGDNAWCLYDLFQAYTALLQA